MEHMRLGNEFGATSHHHKLNQQNKTKQSKAKQSKAKQSKAKKNKTKQNTTTATKQKETKRNETPTKYLLEQTKDQKTQSSQ